MRVPVKITSNGPLHAFSKNLDFPARMILCTLHTRSPRRIVRSWKLLQAFLRDVNSRLMWRFEELRRYQNFLSGLVIVMKR